MRAQVERWLISALITFVLRQVKKFTNGVQWEKLIEDATNRVADLLPGEWLDREAKGYVETILYTAQHALSDERRLNNLLELLADESIDDKPDYLAAAYLLKAYLLKSWAYVEQGKEVSSPARQRAYAAIESFKPLA